MYGETMTLILLLLLGFTTHQGLHNPAVQHKYLFSTEAIRLRRQWIRLVSPAFLHANWGHFAGNAITLFFFGRGLERQLGPEALLGVLFLCVAGGHALCLSLHRRGDYRAVGASGGTLGLLFFTIFCFPGMSILLFPLPIPIPAWLYALFYLGYTLRGLHAGFGGVSHEAHLGGAMSGVLLSLLYFPARVLAQPLLFAAVCILGVAGIWYFHANPGRVPGFLRFRLRGLVDRFRLRQHAREETEIDGLLDKIAREGIQSLTEREKKLLQSASRKRKERA